MYIHIISSYYPIYVDTYISILKAYLRKSTSGKLDHSLNNLTYRAYSQLWSVHLNDIFTKTRRF